MEKCFHHLYKGKRVLVTGHTGFKGAWLSLWLKSLGAEVTGYALPPLTEPSLFNCLGLDKQMNHHFGNVCDYSQLLSLFREVKPEIIFHLAAQAIVRASYEIPRETYETNIMGTVNVLEAVRATQSTRACVIVTSDKCYDNKEWVYAYRENDPMGGLDPYSSSKGGAELVVQAYRHSFFRTHNGQKKTGLASARAGNVIGGGDWSEDRIVPDCMRSLSTGRSILIRNPKAIRPWQHVLEPLSGYLWLGSQLWDDPDRFSEAWNFGPDPQSHVPVQNLVEKTISAWGSGKFEIADRDKEPSQEKVSWHEAYSLKLDCAKAHHLLSWQPSFSLDDSIQQTVEWYKEFYNSNNENLFEFSQRQIITYIEKAKSKKIAFCS